MWGGSGRARRRASGRQGGSGAAALAGTWLTRPGAAGWRENKAGVRAGEAGRSSSEATFFFPPSPLFPLSPLPLSSQPRVPRAGAAGRAEGDGAGAAGGGEPRAPAPPPPPWRVRQRPARPPRASVSSHTLTHTHARTQREGAIFALALAAAAQAGKTRSGHSVRRPWRPRAEPAPISSGASPCAAADKMGAAVARARGLPGARGGLGPARSRGPPQPRAKLGGRGVGPARARQGTPTFPGPGLKRKKNYQTPPWQREGGWRQEWLLSLILVYSGKLQTGRV